MDPNINFEQVGAEADRVALMRRVAILQWMADARTAAIEQEPPAWRLR